MVLDAFGCTFRELLDALTHDAFIDPWYSETLALAYRESSDHLGPGPGAIVDLASRRHPDADGA